MVVVDIVSKGLRQQKVMGTENPRRSFLSSFPRYIKINHNMCHLHLLDTKKINRKSPYELRNSRRAFPEGIWA